MPLPLDSSVPVALGEVLVDTVSLREGRVEKDCVADTVKVTPVGKAVMLTVGVPGMGVLVTVMVILGVLEGEMDTEPLVLEVLELVVEAVTVPEMRAVAERRGVPVPQGEEDCVLVGGWVRVCVTLALGVLVLEALPVMVVEPVALLLTRALPV